MPDEVMNKPPGVRALIFASAIVEIEAEEKVKNGVKNGEEDA